MQLTIGSWPALSDPAYKTRLMKDPHTVLEEAGLSVAPEVKINVVENSDKVLNIVLPPPIEEGEFSEGELEKIAAGAACEPVRAPRAARPFAVPLLECHSI